MNNELKQLDKRLDDGWNHIKQIQSHFGRIAGDLASIKDMTSEEYADCELNYAIVLADLTSAIVNQNSLRRKYIKLKDKPKLILN